MSNASPGLFVTGTDTGIGKTFIAAMIARTLAASGCRVGVYKPLASGCAWEKGRLACPDAVCLWEAAGRPGTLDEVCPQRFRAPLAPHLAARAEGREIDRGLISRQLDHWRSRSDVVIVEGAGGLMSPISDDESNANLAAEFGYPLILVTANRIGVIHQVLATLAAARLHMPPLPIAGVVLNQASQSDDPSLVSNRGELAARIEPPVLADVRHGEHQFGEAIDWLTLAGMS
jgi:dethiobiotin synthetase